jgi:hypothetical protein
VSRPRRPVGRFDAELSGVLGVQPLPARGHHGIATREASDGRSAEKAIQDVEANVPARSTHGNEATIDAGPQRQARATAKRLEFPAQIAVLKRLVSLHPRHRGVDLPARSHPGQLHRSDGPQAPVGYKGRPFAQLGRFGQGLPDFIRRVAQFAHQDERPFLAVLVYPRQVGGPGVRMVP